MERRDFLKKGVAGGGALALAGCRLGDLLAAVNWQKASMPTAILGKTGVEVSRLGVGAYPLHDPNYVTHAQAHAVIHRMVELGVTYLDMAPDYGLGKGEHQIEKKLGPVIKELRDELFLVTKTESPNRHTVGGVTGTWDLLQQSLENMQTDHIDLVLLHNGGHEQTFPNYAHVFSDEGAVGALRDARAQGLIKFIGASGHMYPTRFKELLEYDEIDVIMTANNFVVRHSYNFEEKVLPRARERNIGLVSMKVLGGNSSAPNTYTGRVATEYYDRALRYALGLEDMAVAVIGIQTIAHLERAAEAVRAFVPLSEQEEADLAVIGREMSETDEWFEIYWGRTT